MPEGDTIWRAARALQAALKGRAVTAFATPLPAVAAAARRFALVGRQVAGVEARGKHLLVRFDGGAVLHTHQGMSGSWHLYRKGSRWRQAPHLARVVLEAGEVVAVCFRSPRVELLAAPDAARHGALTRLGPDFLAEAFDPSAARERLRAGGAGQRAERDSLPRSSMEIGAALLDQSRVAGIGNVYKSEVLFLCGLNPFTRMADLGDDALDRVVATARRQMRRNLDAVSRRTRGFPGKHWVYRRSGHPCLRCGTTVERRMQGEPPRSTYFCPGCQPPRQ
jgi:endonuclease VIII